MNLGGAYRGEEKLRRGVIALPSLYVWLGTIQHSEPSAADAWPHDNIQAYHQFHDACAAGAGAAVAAGAAALLALSGFKADMQDK